MDDRIKNVEKDIRLLETSLQEAGFPLTPGSRGGDFVADVRRFVEEQKHSNILYSVVLTKKQWRRLLSVWNNRRMAVPPEDDPILVKLSQAAD